MPKGSSGPSIDGRLRGCPRSGLRLCTEAGSVQSAILVEALRTAEIEPGSRVEQQWKDVCKFYHVQWPKRLAA